MSALTASEIISHRPGHTLAGISAEGFWGRDAAKKRQLLVVCEVVLNCFHLSFENLSSGVSHVSSPSNSERPWGSNQVLHVHPDLSVPGGLSLTVSQRIHLGPHVSAGREGIG